MYTLDDEWFMEHALSLVEEVGKAFGYSLVSLDACGSSGQKASWGIEKDGYCRMIQPNELFHACKDRRTLLKWFHNLGLTS